MNVNKEIEFYLKNQEKISKMIRIMNDPQIKMILDYEADRQRKIEEAQRHSESVIWNLRRKGK